MRVLVVKDDCLSDAGCAVDLAPRTARKGHYLGANEPYDAIVLDLRLPVTRSLRPSHWEVLMATLCRSEPALGTTVVALRPDIPPRYDRNRPDSGPAMGGSQ